MTDNSEVTIVNVSPAKCRDLTQEELDAFWRQTFIDGILEWVNTQVKVATFAIVTKNNLQHLVTVKKVRYGEYEFSVSGTGSWYTYTYSDLISFLEGLYDKSVSTINFVGEVQTNLTKVTSNAKE